MKIRELPSNRWEMICALRNLNVISDLSRLLRVMFITCLIFPISTRNAEETFASFFVGFLVVFTLSSQLGLDSKMPPRFFLKFSIQYFILNPETLRFPC